MTPNSLLEKKYADIIEWTEKCLQDLQEESQKDDDAENQNK